MALTNILLLSQIAGYVIALILSLCITVPMSLHQDEFRGHCLLFSTGVWQEGDGQFKVDWASQAYCNYTIFVGVVLFVVSAIQVYRMSLYLYKGTDSSFLSAFVDVVGSLFLCAMTKVAALMITLGFLVWCDEMTKRFPSCELAAGNAIDLADGIDTSGFPIEMGTAQFGAWASWACWVGLSVFAVLKLCRYHQLENMRVSMYRERQRLINGNNSSAGQENKIERRGKTEGFCRDVDEICALLQYYAASNGNPVRMFWDNASLPSSRVDFLTLEDGTDTLSQNIGKGLPLDTA